MGHTPRHSQNHGNQAASVQKPDYLGQQRLDLAAGEKDPLKYLRSQGIDIHDKTSLPGVAAAITQALDNQIGCEDFSPCQARAP